MAFSFLEYLFFVLEIFSFLHYANEESDDVIGGFFKTVQYSIKNMSRNIKAVFPKLGNRNVHYKRDKMTLVVPLPWQQLCSWQNSQSLILNKDHHQWGELRRYENHVCSEKDTLSTCKCCKWGYSRTLLFGTRLIRIPRHFELIVFPLHLKVAPYSFNSIYT